MHLLELHKYHSLLFDFTGTLVNTEPIHYQSYKRVLADYKITFPNYKDYKRKFAGKTAENTFALVLETQDAELIDRLIAKRREVYSNLIEEGGVEWTNGAYEFIETAKGKGMSLGVVSTSRRHEMDQILVQKKLNTFFDIIISREDSLKSKPSPDGYKQAMQMLGVTPDKSVIFEDSYNGFMAAKASEVEKCFGILQHTIGQPKVPDNYGVIFLHDFTQVSMVN